MQIDITLPGCRWARSSMQLPVGAELDAAAGGNTARFCLVAFSVVRKFGGHPKVLIGWLKHLKNAYFTACELKEANKDLKRSNATLCFGI